MTVTGKPAPGGSGKMSLFSIFSVGPMLRGVEDGTI
jgi:hypothetical protein